MDQVAPTREISGFVDPANLTARPVGAAIMLVSSDIVPQAGVPIAKIVGEIIVMMANA